MIDTKSPLISEFLKDHQLFSRLLSEISKLLDQGNVQRARERARELDRLAGPHIAYEETELYPRLARLGEKTVTEQVLVGQHHDALNAIRLLVGNQPLSEAQLDDIRQGIRDALAHAEHCGTLISFMSRLDEPHQTESLKELRRLRVEGKRWTEL